MSFVPRIYIDLDQSITLVANEPCYLSATIVHYLGNVLRLKKGGRVILFNNRDGEWIGEIEHISKNKGVVHLLEQVRLPILAHGPTLLFAPLKRDATDLAVRMATELGVRIIQPVQTLRTNSQRIKDERLLAIAKEAAEQSNRLTIPEIRSLCSLSEICDVWPQDKPLLIALERGNERKIDATFQPLYNGNEGLLIGPEGGFDECEIEKLLSYKFILPISLGNLVLKAETAIAAGLAKLFPYVKA